MTDNILSSFSLRGSVAWVTGACYGIGMAIAEALAQAGAKLAVNGLNPDHVSGAIAHYREKGFEVYGRVCDVTKEDDVRAFVSETENELGRIDILVNNAGMIRRIPMTDMDAEEFRRVIDVDLVAPYICAKAVIPGMKELGRGKIINICSLMSELGRETVSAYAAAKGGLKMLTKNICAEFGDSNIQCNGIGPGYIATPQTAPLRVPGNSFNQFIIDKTPAARWGEPGDLMGPAVFLASRASDFVNGQVLYVDGGLLATLGKQPG